jgi:NAD(P)-dependent dehydrogenase (short-subunit alcohol dehydrogenase family)
LRLGDNSIFFKADVSKSNEVSDLVNLAIKKFGKLDIMVNNAGIGALGGAAECTDDDWDKVIGINLSGVFFGTREAAKAMIAKDTKGSIINMSSILGVVGMAGAIAYCAAKGGVSNLTRAAAQDLAPKGIRVNAINPAFIETNMTHDILLNEQFSAFVNSNTPLGKPGKPEDIANAAIYLAEDASSYVTGTTTMVDGGWTCK